VPKQSACVALMQLCVPMAFAQLPPVPETPAAELHDKPRLFIAQQSLNLGTVLEGDKHPVRWRLENRGKTDLVIERIKSSCGCAVVELKDNEKVIPPGGSLELKTVFNSQGYRGLQTKTVTVYSNDPTEPELRLEFKANVQTLYDVRPPRMVNLRSVRRGETAASDVAIYPGPGQKAVKILDLQVPDDSPLSFAHEPFDAGGGTAQRIRMTVDKNVSLGTLIAKVTVKLSVDGIERERVISIRGQVVGDLTWNPKVVDVTRQPSPRGKRLTPVTIQSTDKLPFDILGAGAGVLFDVDFKPAGKTRKRTKYSVFLTLRDDAPTGPFGAMLEVQTSSLDQPLIRVPIFGIVAAPIEVEPPMIRLRHDDTPAGTHRRVKLQVLPQLKLEISEITCDNDAVEASVDRKASARYRHLRYLDVRLRSRLRSGTHQAVLTVTTNIAGAERLSIPVTIEVPADPD